MELSKNYKHLIKLDSYQIHIVSTNTYRRYKFKHIILQVRHLEGWIAGYSGEAYILLKTTEHKSMGAVCLLFVVAKRTAGFR